MAAHTTSLRSSKFLAFVLTSLLIFALAWFKAVDGVMGLLTALGIYSGANVWNSVKAPTVPAATPDKS